MTPLMKGGIVGKCDDPRKYPMELHEDYEYHSKFYRHYIKLTKAN